MFRAKRMVSSKADHPRYNSVSSKLLSLVFFSFFPCKCIQCKCAEFEHCCFKVNQSQHRQATLSTIMSKGVHSHRWTSTAVQASAFTLQHTYTCTHSLSLWTFTLQQYIQTKSNHLQICSQLFQGHVPPPPYATAGTLTAIDTSPTTQAQQSLWSWKLWAFDRLQSLTLTYHATMQHMGMKRWAFSVANF